MYAQLTLEERYRLAALLREDFDQKEISERLGRSESTISREVSRHSRSNGTYDARHAHRHARKKRRESKVGSRKIESQFGLDAIIAKQLHPLRSPEVVCVEKCIPVCPATVYNWINRSRPDLKSQLPYQGKKRRRYGTKRAVKQGWTSQVRSIEQRPAAIESRHTPYHWEGDTMHGRNGNLLTYTERRSRFESALLIAKRECDLVQAKTKAWSAKNMVASLTYDRGSEFASWLMIERDTKAKVYFALPHHPWQRGSNENANGRLRRMFPKRFDFSTITQQEVDAVVWMMNHTKRKCLSWRTPCEVYGACCSSS